MMILVDVKVPTKHVQIIRSNIGLESVEKCRDVQNEPILGNFRKKAEGLPQASFFKYRYIFLRLKTALSRY
jgi:hypothetical protein